MLVVTLMLAFLVIFPLWFLLVVWVIVRISGWHRLAEQYPAELPPPNLEWQRASSVQVRRSRFLPMNFNNVVHVAVLGDTVLMRQIRPFGWFGKPLRIPGGHVAGAVTAGPLRERYEFTTTGVPGVTVRVYGRPRALLADRLGK